MRGREWEAPPLLHEGLNTNMLQESLDVALEQSLGSETGDASANHSVVIPGTIWMAIMFVVWHVWQRWWRGARGRVFILPPKAYSTLVDRTRKEMEADGLIDVHPSISDILTAWFFKVIASLLSSDSDVLTSEPLHRQCTLTERLTQRQFIVQA
jgi:hypothetical protein